MLAYTYIYVYICMYIYIYNMGRSVRDRCGGLCTKGNVTFRQKEGKRDRDIESERGRDKVGKSSIFNELNGRI